MLLAALVCIVCGRLPACAHDDRCGCIVSYFPKMLSYMPFDIGIPDLVGCGGSDCSRLSFRFFSYFIGYGGNAPSNMPVFMNMFTNVLFIVTKGKPQTNLSGFDLPFVTINYFCCPFDYSHTICSFSFEYLCISI